MRVSHSPKYPVTVRILLSPFVRKLNNGFIVLITAPIAFFAKATTEASPFTVFLRFSDDFSLILNFEVSSFSFSVKSKSCLAVKGGNISLIACFTGVMTLFRPSKAFLKASISAVLPPRSFQPLRSSFLASDCASINPPTTLLTSVQSFFASSKSPKIVSHVVAHPEPTASLRVSRS